MRKCCALACIMLTICFVISFSFAEEMETITFRGIPFGLTYAEAKPLLVDEGFLFDEYHGGYHTLMTSLIRGRSQGISEYVTLWSSTQKTDNLKIAGYDCTSVSVYFSENPDDGGKMSWENRLFMLANYSFNVMDLDAVFDDFKDKLLAIYGEPDESLSEKNYIYWLAQDNTFVCLKKRFIGKGSMFNEIAVYYGTFDGTKWLQRVMEVKTKEALDKEHQLLNNGNTDGL